MENLFLTASRNKFRFVTSNGLLTAEDLWDLPLSSHTAGRANLDDIAKALSKQIKDSEEQSFVKPPTTKGAETKQKFDLVLFVIKTKMEERDAETARAEKAANKQKIMALIEKKKDAALEAKSAEELQALLSTM